MRVTYYQYFKPDVSVHQVTDDFGNEIIMHDLPYSSFDRAKLFVTGFTFDGASFLSFIDTITEH